MAKEGGWITGEVIYGEKSLLAHYEGHLGNVPERGVASGWKKYTSLPEKEGGGGLSIGTLRSVRFEPDNESLRRPTGERLNS